MIDPLFISELFYSIQGESTWAGLPCAFIRLSGCNLRCRYCDASYTWEEPGTEMAIRDILKWVLKYPGVLTEITGGEPLLQDNIHLLTELLIDNGHKVLIETNGTISLEDVHPQATVIMDIKCPESGMHDKVNLNNLDLLARRKEQGSRDEIKFVLSSEQDFHWALEAFREHRLDQLVPVLFSPVSGLIEPKHLAELVLAYQLPVRIQLQLHTLLWPDQNRGV
ncbi:MAG: radical SAM protein [Desulfobulbaceae bacterium]|nr:radical SAM protein [Desulfobulbaceae bacterium]